MAFTAEILAPLVEVRNSGISCCITSAANTFGPMSTSRAAKVTAEHREESAKLKAIWDETGHRGMSQAEFGAQFEIGTQAAVGFFLNGNSPISLKAARGFARGLRCNIADFSPRLAAEAAQNAEFAAPTESDFVDIPRVDVTAAAGHGGTIGEVVETVGSLKFSRTFLDAIGVSAATARIVSVKGPSMEPTIPDGAVLLVSTKNREPRHDKIFALARPAEGLIVKRLVRTAKGWVARSDNQEFADIPIGAGEPVSIIGRAHWMGAKL